MKTVIKICIPVVLFLLLQTGCQKKLPPAAGEAPPPSGGVQESRPDDPIQGLAWDTAKAALGGLRSPHMLALTLRIGQIENEALLPDPPREALLKAFRQDLERAGIEISDTSELLLTGKISKREGSLVFAFTISNIKQRESIYSDSASVSMDARLKNTLSQFDHEETRPHKETKIPSPLAELEDAPLDVLPACDSSGCTLLLLYEDVITVLDWQKGETHDIAFAPQYIAAEHSRAPSGKIIPFANGYIVMHNGLSRVLYYNGDYHAPLAVYNEKPDWLPIPDPGENTYSLGDGHFYDFDLIAPKTLAVIGTDQKLALASEGKLITSDRKVGGTLCSLPPVIYTSSPVLPGQTDSIMKFSIQNGTLQLITSRPVDGQIMDLAISDLNQDGQKELLVTIRTAKGILVDAQTPF